MPRKLRMYLAGVPSHVIQRGNNREACFFTEPDYQFYFDCVTDACRRYQVELHAYVFMTNHTHLLMTPSDETGIPRVMQSLERRYVQYVNYLYQHAGMLWESQHKASLVDAERYLLSCYRYIELNPVRANMATEPAEYRWSSYRFNAKGKMQPELTPHPLYLSLGITAGQRRANYQDLFSSPLIPDDIHAIRNAIQLSKPLGDDQFKQRIEKASNQHADHIEDSQAYYLKSVANYE